MTYDNTKTNESGTYDAADTQTIWAEDWNTFVSTFKTHQSRHTSWGEDALYIDTLAPPSDNISCDVSIAAHGFCPKLPNDATKFLRGDGSWAVPVGTGDVVGPASATDGYLVVFSGTTGKLVKDGGATTAFAAASHNHAATDINSSTLDGDRLPALSETKKGGCPATGTPSGKYLKDDGTWASPAGAGDVVGPASATNNNFVAFDATTGKLIKDSGSAAATFAAASHNHSASNITSDTIDGDRLPAMSSSKKGGVPATGTPSGKFLTDDGTWSSPAGAGDVVGPASSTADHVVTFDGVTGKLIKDSGAVLSSYATLANPTLTGVPAAPTAAADTDTTQIATTAFVLGQASDTNPAMNGTAAPGTSEKYSRYDHVHASDTSRAASTHAHAETDLTLTDVTTANANTTNHGLVVKATAPASGYRNVVGIDNAETAYTNKGLYTTTTPSMDSAAATGTSLYAARIDHVHPSDTTKSASTHTHGNITNAGAIGSTSGLAVVTTTSGALTTGTVAVASGGSGQTSYTDGQLLIGNSTGNTLSKATLTEGSNVTITNGHGTITIAAASGSAITGSIIIWPTSSAPSGYLKCDGSAVSRSTYSALYAVIGTTFGVGDGSTTFNLPNTTEKFVMGVGATYTLASTGGATTHTLTTPEIPSHTHTSISWSASGADGVARSVVWTSSGGTTGATGGGSAHSILNPYLALYYCIKT